MEELRFDTENLNLTMAALERLEAAHPAAGDPHPPLESEEILRYLQMKREEEEVQIPLSPSEREDEAGSASTVHGSLPVISWDALHGAIGTDTATVSTTLAPALSLAGHRPVVDAGASPRAMDVHNDMPPMSPCSATGTDISSTGLDDMDIDQLTDVSSTGLSRVPTLKELSQDLMTPVQAEAPAARRFLPLGRITTTARRGYRAPTLTPSPPHDVPPQCNLTPSPPSAASETSEVIASQPYARPAARARSGSSDVLASQPYPKPSNVQPRMSKSFAPQNRITTKLTPVKVWTGPRARPTTQGTGAVMPVAGPSRITEQGAAMARRGSRKRKLVLPAGPAPSGALTGSVAVLDLTGENYSSPLSSIPSTMK